MDKLQLNIYNSSQIFHFVWKSTKQFFSIVMQKHSLHAIQRSDFLMRDSCEGKFRQAHLGTFLNLLIFSRQTRHVCPSLFSGRWILTSVSLVCSWAWAASADLGRFNESGGVCMSPIMSEISSSLNFNNKRIIFRLAFTSGLISSSRI